MYRYDELDGVVDLTACK